jgi:hypothetical protein
MRLIDADELQTELNRAYVRKQGSSFTDVYREQALKEDFDFVKSLVKSFPTFPTPPAKRTIPQVAESFGIDTSEITSIIMGNLPALLSQEEYDFSIKQVIFHDPATIVYWADGSKTVVKCHNEPFDKEKGLAMAVIKKNWPKSYKKLFEKWCS